MGLETSPTAAEVAAAEQIACEAGLVVVSAWAYAVIVRLETAPWSVRGWELDGLSYELACLPVRTEEGRVRSPQRFGERTGGGGLRTKSAPPLFPHQRRQ